MVRAPLQKKVLESRYLHHPCVILLTYLDTTYTSQIVVKKMVALDYIKILKEVHHCEYFHHHPIFSFAVLYTFFLLQFRF